MKSIIINSQEFKQINQTYYINYKGDVYSNYCKKIIKPLKRTYKKKEYLYIDIWNGEKQVHTPIHHLVYETWIGPIKPGQQINHKDDNTFNNDYHNLYQGNQKDNIQDCLNNDNRVGNIYYLTLYDKQKQQTISFCPAKDFIKYSGHSCANGSLKRMFSRNWFNKRYEILEYKKINNIDELKGVTTMGDECNPVE